ncbi:MAG: tetratricopeptide repeat protein [Alphaproteobacteria bacterium]
MSTENPLGVALGAPPVPSRPPALGAAGHHQIDHQTTGTCGWQAVTGRDWFDYGATLAARGAAGQAVDAFDRALALDPDNPEIRWRRGLARLAIGDYAGGWADAEARRLIPGFPLDLRPEPLWQGEMLAGRTLLIQAEQGLADTLQFVRYVRGLAEHAEGRVVLAAQAEVLPVVESAVGADAVVMLGQDPVECDCWVPLLSLPGILGPAPLAMPAYLDANPVRIATWGKRLARISRPRIGIAWRDGDRDNDFVSYEHVARLAATTGIKLVALPADDIRLDLGGIMGSRIVDLGADLGADGTLADLAAVVAGLDLVIAPDGVLAHLAGALGTAVWTVLPAAPGWRWERSGMTTPWYPSMRLFRPAPDRGADAVFARIAAAIAARSTVG